MTRAATSTAANRLSHQLRLLTTKPTMTSRKPTYSFASCCLGANGQYNVEYTPRLIGAANTLGIFHTVRSQSDRFR
jgi:hypothetical protein